MSDSDPKLGAYAPPPEDYETFDAREGEPDRRGPILLLAAVAVLVLFSAVVWNAYRLGVRDSSESPIVAADTQPYRVPPDDPEGYQTPGQDIGVYDLRTGLAGGENESPAEVRPGPEEPIAAPVRAPDRPEEGGMPALRVETVDADAVDPSTVDTPARAEPMPRPAPDRPAAATSQTPDAAPSPAQASPTGSYVVQIGAFRSDADAREAWSRFTGRFSELSSGYAADIARVDLGDNGIYHRLRVAAFATREDAVRYCAQLNAGGQDCLVARR